MYMKALLAGVIKFSLDVFDASGLLPFLIGGGQHGDDLVDGFLGLPVSKLHGLSVVRAHNEFRLAAGPLSGVIRPALGGPVNQYSREFEIFNWGTISTGLRSWAERRRHISLCAVALSARQPVRAIRYSGL
jgi:hypothetical protein